MRHERDQGDLAHVGRLAAHVGPGDEEELARRAHAAVVRNERFTAVLLEISLDHGMPPGFDFQAWLFGEVGPAVVAQGGRFSERGEHIELGKRACDRL